MALKLGVLHGLALLMLWGCSNTHTSSGPGKDGAGGATASSGESTTGVSTTGASTNGESTTGVFTTGVSTNGVTGTSMGIGGSSGATSGDCDPGAKDCDELTPMACTEDGTWAPARGPCAIACVLGECAECADSNVTCRAGDVQVCTDGAWVVQEECDNVCEAGLCKDTCTEGWLRCSDNVLQQCEGPAYVDQETCEFLCADEQDGTAACTGECVPDAKRCNQDGEAETCSGDGEWDQANATTCDAGTFCVNGDCKPCEPGSSRCSDGLPQQCGSDGEWVDQGACNDEALPHCLEGECVACEPSARRCLDNDLEECVTDGSDWQLLESCSGDTPACLADRLVCGDCEPNSTQCNDNNVQSCEDGEWMNLTACSGSTPKCVDGSCSECTPGTVECLDEGTRQTCQNDGTWGSGTACSGDTAVCQDGACVECLNGDMRPCGDCSQGTQSCTNGSWGNCADDGEECVPVPPAGWDGPVVVHDSDLGGPAPDCEGDFAAASADFYADLQAPAAQCDCECGNPAGSSVRCRPHFEMHTDSGCQGNSFADLDPLQNSSCSSYWSGPIMGSVDVTALNVEVQASGACTSSLDESLPSVSWGTTVTSCAPTAALSECVTGMFCAEPPPDEFNRGYCVYRAGDRSCPAAYSGSRVLSYQSFDDTRGCSSCSCGTPAGFTCNWSFVVSADDVCSETPITGTGCVNLGLGEDTMWWRNTSSASGGTCAPSGGAANGSASPAEPVTICCID